MARASVPLHTAQDVLAEARERFLAAEPVDTGAVRKPILASWWRSRQWNVAADHIELNYLRDPDLESNLARTADPVLRHLHEQLDGQPISIILTDAAGMVLTRMTADHDLERPWTGSSWLPASATPRTRSAPTASAPRWSPAARPTSSGTSTTPSTWRAWPAPGCRSTTRSRARRSASST